MTPKKLYSLVYELTGNRDLAEKAEAERFLVLLNQGYKLDGELTDGKA